VPSPVLSVKPGTVEVWAGKPREGIATMVLLRHLLGDALRRLRLRQGRTLREVSASARVSLGYLSEVERGQKEASSELLAAICSALGTPLSQVLREVSDNFALAELQSEPVFADVIEPGIEVAGAGRAPEHGRHEAGEPVAVGPGAGAGRARPAVAVPSAAGMGHLGRVGPARLSAAPVGAVAQIAVPGGAALPLGPGIRVDEPVFDQVSRSAREISNMVPV